MSNIRKAFPGLIAFALGAFVFAASPVTHAALIGVDFNQDTNQDAPTNWEVLSASNDLPGTTPTPLNLTNMTDESGGGTSVDLSVNSSVGTIRGFSNTLDPLTIPSHTNSLTNLNGYFHNDLGDDDTVTATFSDLAPSTAYDVWVFGTRVQAYHNLVTIVGSGAPINFEQEATTDELFVNSMLGDSSLSLDSYALSVTSSVAGTITISWTEGANATRYSVGGLAIEQSIPEPSTIALAGLGISLIAMRRKR